MKKFKTTFQKVCKYMFLGSAIFLISVAALRFTVINVQSAHEAIMSFYFLFFGIVLVLQQLGLRSIKRNFRFLNYHWGKASFSMFVGLCHLSNGQNQFLQYISAAYFFTLTIMFIVLAVIDRQSDKDRYFLDEEASGADMAKLINDRNQSKRTKELKEQREKNPSNYYLERFNEIQQKGKRGVEELANSYYEEESNYLSPGDTSVS